MLGKSDITNAILFMKRVQATGEECLAWTQTYQALNDELAALNPPTCPVVAPPPSSVLP